MAAHDADQVIGRIRKDGGWDQRYRLQADPHSSEEEEEGMLEIIAGIVVMSLIAVGLIVWSAIAAASQVPA